MNEQNTLPRRTRQTRPSVIWIDRLTRVVITLGGIGTIVAVSAVAVFLFVVAMPLFLPPKVEPRGQFAASSPLDWRFLATDAEKLVGVGITAEGKLIAWNQVSATTILERSLDLPAPISAVSASVGNEDVYFGLANGSFVRAQVKWEESFPQDAEVEEASALEVGQVRSEATGVITRTKAGALRRTKANVSIDTPLASGSADAITSIDHIPRKPGTLVATVHQSREVRLHEVVTKPTPSLATHAVATNLGRREPIAQARLFGKGNRLLCLGDHGSYERLDIKSLSQPKWIEAFESDGSMHPPGTLLAPKAEWVVGRETLLESRESQEGTKLSASFLVRSDDDPPATADGLHWTWAKSLSLDEGTQIDAMVLSPKLRVAAVADTGHHLHLFQLTTGEKIARVPLSVPGGVTRLAFSPGDDAILVGHDDGCLLMSLELRHPEATPGSLFRPVWYESYARPAHVWQSDSAGGAEPKFGMMPLVFGSIKATVYSMLFGAPLAILAAIYTSEFLPKSSKARIKPTIELMAGLPSVVLGFIAAMVLAPLVSQHLVTVLLSFFVIPWTFLLLGHLWQTLPSAITLRLANARFLFILLTLPMGIGLTQWLAPWVERVCFVGDLKDWLDGQGGSAVPGWTFLLLPISGLMVAWLFGRVVDAPLRGLLYGMSRPWAAGTLLLRFLVGTLAAIGLAAAFGALLSAIGWDPRGTVVDTYIQRNSLVVGFVMGFAIIPIIYTLADDALATVPENLRSASLGAGATPWQTAILIVVPAAMSGIFSAIMVGLGRAVGETMIVLMAAGSSPIMQWNIFNGFRTLSANIAIELPEAVQGSTHYRVLFFAAVVLFLLTSVLNTVAEIVRIRFRQRGVQL
jgi:phosphate transport system permease protein